MNTWIRIKRKKSKYRLEINVEILALNIFIHTSDISMNVIEDIKETSCNPLLKFN